MTAHYAPSQVQLNSSQVRLPMTLGRRFLAALLAVVMMFGASAMLWLVTPR